MSFSELPVLSVTQLTHAIKHSLESMFSQICIQGEISNLKMQSSGHLYFSLKDSQAQIAAVMFKADVNLLKSIPKDGNQVIIKGEIHVYAPSGKYQIVVRELRYVGLGELLLKLEELKQKILKKGWFKKELKKKIPSFPKTIGVVTSPTGAVIQDIIHVLKRRYPNFHLILNPVKVQGEGAPKEIAQAINQFNELNLVDVIIVGRGGGSLEDLWAFNEEIVAEAIYNSHIPIISAVGHETDHCIADYVADIRAPTPSAAAEIVMGERAQVIKYLWQLQQQIELCLSKIISQKKKHLQLLKKQPFFTSPYTLLADKMQKMDDIKDSLTEIIQLQVFHRKKSLLEKKKQLLFLKPNNKLNNYKSKLLKIKKEIDNTYLDYLRKKQRELHLKSDNLQKKWLYSFMLKKQRFEKKEKEKTLVISILRVINQKKVFLKNIQTILESIDPKNLLNKGYCILFSEKKDSVITTVDSVNIAQPLTIVLSDGEVFTTVTKVEKNDTKL
ncbi:Exodeoxyribonuclease 7 large subunit [Candidatus Rubidus massiliensis]|nr:Exodeoxyribonuclease 7 large subunit [Candidatus Rubidus massiliensis]